jgi:hypothetical protein
MHTSAAGFLLFLLGAIALAGFLTGNLDRWLGFLFSAGGDTSMGVSGAVTKPAAAPAAGVVAPSANQRGQAG